MSTEVKNLTTPTEVHNTLYQLKSLKFLLLLIPVSAQCAAPAVVNTPPAISSAVYYIPPSAAFPSGLDTTHSVPLPPVHEKSQGTQVFKNNLPVKTVSGQSFKMGHYYLTSLKYKK